jgi:hypothetical protein
MKWKKLKYFVYDTSENEKNEFEIQNENFRFWNLKKMAIPKKWNE